MALQFPFDSLTNVNIVLALNECILNLVMNWTEGALARHSRRKGWDKDVARQKKYFAKVRARKNAPASSKGLDITSFVPDYIPQTQRPQDSLPASFTPAKKPRTPKRRLIHGQPDANRTPRRDFVQGVNLELPKPNGATENPPARLSENDCPELDIATKRRRLLEKADWTGVSTQKPLTVDFAWQKDHSLISKETHRFRQDHKSSLTLNRPNSHDRFREKTLGRLSDNEMRINIGSQNLRWSRNSNSVRSFATRQGFAARDSQSVSTLRLRPISPYQQSASAHKPTRTTARFQKSSQYPDSLGSRNQSSRTPDTILSNTEDPASQEAEYGTPDEPRFVVNAHTPIIHQPRPTRETWPLIFDIRSPEVEENLSTTAVLGAPRRPSERMTSEDIQWNIWLNSSAKTARKEPTETSEARDSPSSISPGISQYWNSWEEDSQTQSPVRNETLHQRSLSPTDELQLPSSEIGPSKILVRDSVRNEILDSEMQGAGHPADLPDTSETRNSLKHQNNNRSKASIKPQMDLAFLARTNLRVTSKDLDLLDLSTESEEKNEVLAETQVEQEMSPYAEDEDEIWKKFVLDDNIIETNRKARNEAHEQTKRDLGFKKKSFHAFEDPSLSSSSTAPRSDVAEPPSASRDRPLLLAKQTLDAVDEQIGEQPGADSDSSQEEPPSSEAAAKTNVTDNIGSVVAQPPSPQQSQAEFKFHQPRLFIGRLAGDTSSNKPSVPLYPPPKKSRRWKKRRDQGRPDFRTMPDYDDDPIEED